MERIAVSSGADLKRNEINFIDQENFVKRYSGKELGCNKCSSTAPLRKVPDGYLCEKHFKEMKRGS